MTAVRSEIQDNKAKIQGLQNRATPGGTRRRPEAVRSTTKGPEVEGETEEDSEIDEEDEEDLTEEGNILQESWERMKDFCHDWGVDCRMIMMVGLATTAAWALSTGVMVAVTVQIVRLTIRTRRICQYLDLRSTDTKQEDHDEMVLDKKKKGRDYPHPNPSRNYVQLGHLADRIKQMKEDARQNGANIDRLNHHVALLEAKEETETDQKTERLRQNRRPRD